MQKGVGDGYREFDSEYSDHPRHTGATVDTSLWEEQARVESRYELGRLEGELDAAKKAQDDQEVSRILAVIEAIRASFVDYDAEGNRIPLRAWPLGDENTFDEVWNLDGRRKDEAA